MVALRCLSPALPPGRIFPDLSSNDMLLFIVKGISLPTPPGEGAPGKGQGCGVHQARGRAVGSTCLPNSDPCLPAGLSPGDLDVFVRFDFPYPNVVHGELRRDGLQPPQAWGVWGRQGFKGRPQPLSFFTSCLVTGRSSERQDQRDQKHRLPW